ncbi:MAG TPA: AAA family ATPase [Phycisphaerae bacterium]|nr:AAA family ATPase [Phycisphaerae bacterium]
MWVSRLEIENIRSWAKAEFDFSKGINVLVGPNNSGKSTIIHSLFPLQKELPNLTNTDLRVDAPSGWVAAHLARLDSHPTFLSPDAGTVRVELARGKNPVIKQLDSQGDADRFDGAPGQEPDHFIYPFLSKRKVQTFEQKVDAPTMYRIAQDWANLNAKIARVADAAHPAHERYKQVCHDILGMLITTTASEHGQMATYTIPDRGRIPISAMGDGVPNILGLIVHLCVADDKLFLIEEPENDLHPEALKKLLALVSEKAHTNQFIITTHSNLVVTQLGAQAGTRLFHVDVGLREGIPTSTKVDVADSRDERRRVLESLGYELIDYGLWDAWLFLEESSAETIIRDHLVRWFVPELLGRLRTFSADSISKVKPKFETFNTLIVYLHLTPVYRNKAWVIVDAGDEEKKVIDSLKEMYCRDPNGEARWCEERFLQFSKHDFEQYYPEPFRAKVDEILRVTDKPQRRQQKIQLLENVEAWIARDPDEAKNAFEQSAAEVIDKLRRIERELKL